MTAPLLADPGPLRRAAIHVANLAGRGLRRVRVRGIPRLMSFTGPVLVGPGVRLVPTANGPSLCIDGRDYFACMMFYGRFGADLLALIDATVGPGDRVVDVGAQLGYITSYLAERVGKGGRVTSFEPDPTALSRLRRAVEANGHTQVKVMPIAASDREGEITFHVSPTVGWSTAVAGTHLHDLEDIVVRAARLDDLRKSGEIEGPVRLLKIDVEGHEAHVLDGAEEILKNDRPFVVIEINPELLAPAGHTPFDVLKRLESKGYRLHRVEERAGLLSGGRIELLPIDARADLGFCDVLATPEERAVPRVGAR